MCSSTRAMKDCVPMEGMGAMHVNEILKKQAREKKITNSREEKPRVAMAADKLVWLGSWKQQALVVFVRRRGEYGRVLEESRCGK